MIAAKEKTFSPSRQSTFNWSPRGTYVQAAATSNDCKLPTIANAEPVVSRFTQNDFRARKSKKSPIGSTVRIQFIALIQNHQRPRENTRQNRLQLRRSHLAPEMSQYRGYFVPGAVDPSGTDIIPIFVDDGHSGHAGMIVGNKKDGYYLYSYATENYEDQPGNIQRYGKFDNVIEALERAGEDGYNAGFAFLTTPQQDAAAAEVAESWDDKSYNILTQNCGHMVVAALEAADIELEEAVRPVVILSENRDDAFVDIPPRFFEGATSRETRACSCGNSLGSKKCCSGGSSSGVALVVASPAVALVAAIFGVGSSSSGSYKSCGGSKKSCCGSCSGN